MFYFGSGDGLAVGIGSFEGSEGGGEAVATSLQ